MTLPQSKVPEFASVYLSLFDPKTGSELENIYRGVVCELTSKIISYLTTFLCCLLRKYFPVFVFPTIM